MAFSWLSLKDAQVVVVGVIPLVGGGSLGREPVLPISAL